MSDQGRRDDDRKAARLRGFKLHLGAYFAVMTVLVIVNLTTTPDRPWFVWPMVGWGPILAVHTAWAMGLFDRLSRGK
jgi:hypothetical protein